MVSLALAPAPHEVVRTFLANTKAPTREQRDALARRGISALAIGGGPDTSEVHVAFARIAPEEGHRFEFAADGTPATAVIALNEFAEPIDIVATIKGGWIGAWLGRSALLGVQHLNRPRLDEALPIYPTVADWLRGEREGLVLVNPARAARELRDGGPYLATGGFDHAAQLVSVLTAPTPRVLIRDPAEERRAA